MGLFGRVNLEPPAAALPGRQTPHLGRELHNPQLVIWAGSIPSPWRLCLITGWMCAREEGRERNEEEAHKLSTSPPVFLPGGGGAAPQEGLWSGLGVARRWPPDTLRGWGHREGRCKSGLAPLRTRTFAGYCLFVPLLDF